MAERSSPPVRVREPIPPPAGALTSSVPITTRNASKFTSLPLPAACACTRSVPELPGTALLFHVLGSLHSPEPLSPKVPASAGTATSAPATSNALLSPVHQGVRAPRSARFKVSKEPSEGACEDIIWRNLGISCLNLKLSEIQTNQLKFCDASLKAPRLTPQNPASRS